MIKIGITGSLASGKTTVSKILSSRKGHFSADAVVKKLYSKKNFRILYQINLKSKIVQILKKS